MATELKSQPQGGSQPQGPAHEQRDANAKWIFGIIIFLLLSIGMIHFVLGGFLARLKGGAAPTDAWQPVTKSVRAAPEPPSFPRLQISPAIDLQSFRAREEMELNQYGWINKTAGIVRVPIERAMEMVLQKGFPVRKPTNGNATGPSSYDLIQQRLLRKESQIKGEQ